MEQVRERVLALAGRVVANYRLERVLSGGAAAVMYLGRREGKKPQPITRPGLPPLLLPELALIDLIPLQEQRAERAAKLRQHLSQLQRLGNQSILPLLECGDDPVSGCVYAIYPYPAGGSLADRLTSAKDKPLPYPEVTAYLKEVAGALDTAHQQGFFHLHLSADTIFLDANGTAYLAEIGLAQILGLEDSIAEGSLYAAPEQIIHDPALPTTDVYGLGMVLYQLVTGHTAFDSTRQQLQSPPPPSQYRPDLPAQIEAVILRAISSYPAQRYATAGLLSYDFALAIKNSESRSAAKGIHHSAEGDSKESGQAGAMLTSEDESTVKVVPVSPAGVTPPQESANKSFVYSSPPPTGTTRYPPEPQPQWELPTQLTDQMTPTQELVPANGKPMGIAKSKAASKRPRRAWGVSLVAGMIVLVCVALLAVLIFPRLNRGLSLPSIPLPGHGGGSSTSAIGSDTFSASVGASLYETTAPGICDKKGASWAANSEAEQVCGSSNMLLSAPACQTCSLAVVALGNLPGQTAYTANYAAMVTVQPLATDSSVPFGFKFRQQSLQDEGQQRGGYSYLVDQNGQWEFDKYSGDGSRQQLAQGKLSAALPPNSALGLVVHGSTYFFYVNGKEVAAETDSTYNSGYICLVVAPSASVLFSEFSLSRLR
ncbi:MAG: protein kinase domain-containing protein [Ktedonobacterales bacterium]